MILIDEKDYLQLLQHASELDTDEKAQKFAFLMREAYKFDHVNFSVYNEEKEEFTRLWGTYPADWVSYYNSEPDRKAHDPILRYLKRHKPFLWSEISFANAAEREFMERTFEAGVGPNGFTIPFRSSDGLMTLISATQKDISPENWLKKIAILKKDLVEIGGILHTAYLRQLGVEPPSILLSGRSIDCLKMKRAA